MPYAGPMYLPDEEPTDAALEAELRSYLELPGTPGVDLSAPAAPPEPRNYLDEASLMARRAMGPHASQAAENFLMLSPVGALRDYQEAGVGVARDLMGGNLSGAALGVPMAAMALMGAAPGGQAGRAAAKGLKPWRAPETPEEHILGYHGSPHVFDPVRVVQETETGRRTVLPQGQPLPAKLQDDVAAGKATVEEHPYGAFDLNRMGTGEGAQAYGPGHYIAEAEKVSKYYREGLSNMKVGEETFDPNNARHQAAVMLSDSGERALASERLRHLSRVTDTKKESEAYAEAADLIDRGAELPSVRPGGATYEVAIKGKPEEFLDWDAPLGQQPKKVREALGVSSVSELPPDELLKSFLASDYAKSFSSASDVRQAQRIAQDADPLDIRMWAERQREKAGPAYNLFERDTGSSIWETLVREHGDPDTAAAALRESGIKGIRYKDAMSRTPVPAYKGRPIKHDIRTGDTSFAERFVARYINDGNAPADALEAAKSRIEELLADPSHRRTPRRESDMKEAVSEIGKMKASDWGMERQTSNYVVMDDATIDILRKYGMAGLIGGGAAAGQAVDYLGSAAPEETPTGA